MAIGCHVVYLAPMRVNSAGVVVDANDGDTTMKEMLATSTEMRVIASASAPSSTGNPTIETYLRLEAAGNYKLGTLSQTMIVTYNG